MGQKLDIGRVFSGIFRVYGQQLGLLVPAALIVFLPVAIANGLIESGSDAVLLTLLASLLSLVASYWYQGMVVEAVRDMQDGRSDFSLGGLFRSVVPVIGPLIGAGILAGIGVLIGLVLLIIPGLFLLTIWALIAPVIVVERAGVLESFGRSRELVRGNGWQVFGVIVLLFIVQFVLVAILTAIAVAISDTFVGYGLASLVANVILAPLTALAAATMYFELVRLKEARGASAVDGPAAEDPPYPGQSPGAEDPPYPGRSQVSDTPGSAPERPTRPPADGA